ncbi:MAG: right-handed parallel beta-helix repeat-containing protein [Verrucomicrobia bacterium]|nr:right-handed parallel beta-helix repeat-containing protein [Verrucomicrobiota bacterium]MDA1006400.1 right-handed parallel beta-helix repeat-containing protein [Verrucomicrobiota bacterium]
MFRSVLLSLLGLSPCSAEISLTISPDQLTLDQALTQLRTLRANGKTEPASLLIPPGLHSTNTILDPALVGKGLTCRALKPDEPCPVLTAGTELTNWTLTDNLWSTPLEHEPAGLFTGDQPCTLARMPNDDFWRIEKTGPDRRTSFTWQENTIPEVKDLANLSLVFLHDWSTTHVEVLSLDPATRTLSTKLSIGPKADHYRIGHFEPQPRFFLQGSRDFLDAPGEYYYDRSAKRLFYMPLPGKHPATTSIIATTIPHALLLHGTGDQPLQNLHFEHLAFSHAQWLPAGRRFAGGQASFHEDGESFTRTPVPCAVEADHCRELSFVNCHFSHSSGGGLWLRENCRDIQIRKCTFTDLGANGLMIGVPGDPKHVTSHLIVEDSLIARCGQRYYGSVGLWIGIAAHCTIRNNEIHDLPYTGFSLGWRWSPVTSPSRNHLIENNHIHHVLQTLSDGGGIYTLGLQPDSIIRGNHIHDVRVNAGRAESNGIFIDQGSTGFLVENNDIHHIARSPIRFHQAGKNTLRNNKLEPSDGIPPLRFNNSPEENITVE